MVVWTLDSGCMEVGFGCMGDEFRLGGCWILVVWTLDLGKVDF